MTQSYQKVCVLGAGKVGGTLVQILANYNLCHEIWIKDSNIDVAKGVALDTMQSAILRGSSTQVHVVEEASEIEGCQILFFCAGSPRLPGMSRDDLLLANAKVVSTALSSLSNYLQNTIIVMVTNPLDAMVYTALHCLGLKASQVIGMAGVLDSARMSYFIAEKLGFGAGHITASVMGGHGDDMLPLERLSSVGGIPLTDLLSQKEIEDIIQKTRNGGAQIVNYFKNGSAYYAPAMSVAKMANAILRDTNEILPCSVLLQGEYGYSDVCTGVPVLLGQGGVKKVFEIRLTDKEKELFARSIQSVQSLIQTLKSHQVC
ncbi:malate dehydrogenase [Helicobacter monodelphidis]|uniref:malate dehydrogenase n=1 Tax=Helicobacter sp. 15-1451 TaxID=2004995 RepID=UPI000DCCD32A|nr:malate dehydrogenase [Helicobacter sp. 15-1451]RAX57818.1 malate dehydrogenase [Helicobacter sp. 15-1451]